jgi:hypothetical protein
LQFSANEGSSVGKGLICKKEKSLSDSNLSEYQKHKTFDIEDLPKMRKNDFGEPNAPPLIIERKDSDFSEQGRRLDSTNNTAQSNGVSLI